MLFVFLLPLMLVNKDYHKDYHESWNTIASNRNECRRI